MKKLLTAVAFAAALAFTAAAKDSPNMPKKDKSEQMPDPEAVVIVCEEVAWVDQCPGNCPCVKNGKCTCTDKLKCECCRKNLKRCSDAVQKKCIAAKKACDAKKAACPAKDPASKTACPAKDPASGKTACPMMNKSGTGTNSSSSGCGMM